MNRSNEVSRGRYEGYEGVARRTTVGRFAGAALFAVAAFAAPSLASAQDVERAGPSATPSRTLFSPAELAVAHRPGRVTVGALVGLVAGAAAAFPGGFFIITSSTRNTGAEMFVPFVASMLIPAQFAIAGTVYGIGAAFHGAGGFWLTYAGTWVGAAAGAGLIAATIALPNDANEARWVLGGLGALMPLAGALVAYELSSSARLAAAQQTSHSTRARAASAPLMSLAPTRDGVGLHLAGQF